MHPPSVLAGLDPGSLAAGAGAGWWLVAGGQVGAQGTEGEVPRGLSCPVTQDGWFLRVPHPLRTGMHPCVSQAHRGPVVKRQDARGWGSRTGPTGVPPTQASSPLGRWVLPGAAGGGKRQESLLSRPHLRAST